ncbi:MAG: conjugal transfer protein TraX, partial [Peptococcaceae bacterium]|nr:conjugal transfer protein TraX [Peptococcaceae bacterium]
GETVFLTRQGLALLALIPIWLYEGKQGYYSKWWKYFCYAFYPVHLLILGLLKFVL